MLANLENSAVATGLEKVSFYSNPKERQCQRVFQLLHNCTHLTHYQRNAQIFQVRLQQYMNSEFPDVQAGFRTGREPEIKLSTSTGSWKKQKSSRKTSIFTLLTMPKSLTRWITLNWGTVWKRWEYMSTWPASWEICIQVRKQQLELDTEQETGSK